MIATEWSVGLVAIVLDRAAVAQLYHYGKFYCTVLIMNTFKNNGILRSSENKI